MRRRGFITSLFGAAFLAANMKLGELVPMPLPEAKPKSVSLIRCYVEYTTPIGRDWEMIELPVKDGRVTVPAEYRDRTIHFVYAYEQGALYSCDS